jgi:hypothetical protein
MKRLLILTNGQSPHRHFTARIRQSFPCLETRVFAQSSTRLSLKEKVGETYIKTGLPVRNNLLLLKLKAYEKYFKNHPQDYFSENECHNLNEPYTVEAIQKYNPDVILVLGGKKIPPELYTNCLTIHLHCGLVPWYRGGATWYSNFLTRDFSRLGFTLQELNDVIDGGDVYDQFVISLNRGDSVWDAYCKAVKAGTEATIELLQLAYLEQPLQATPPISGYNHTGKYLFDKRRVKLLKTRAYYDGEVQNKVELIQNNLTNFRHENVNSDT